MLRFSEFVAFHKELRANWTLDDVALPALPPKRLKMFGLDLSDKLRDSRSRALSEYLDVICKCEKQWCIIPVLPG
jgi:PX domain